MGVTGLVDSASANYEYKHNPRHDYKFDSHHNNLKVHRSNYGYAHKKYYKKRYRHNSYSHKKSYNYGYKRPYVKKYSRKNRGYYNKGYSYGYHENRNRHYSYGSKSRNKHYSYGNKSRDKHYSHGNKSGYKNHKKYYGYKPASRCYSYKVTVQGGKGGFRFQHSTDAFQHINNGSSYVNKICGYENVEFELSKVDPGVSVSIEINGRYFNYPAHSGHDSYINNWHRKYFSVNFKRHY